MPRHRFQANEERSMGIDARSYAGYRTLAYDGNLGGGTLRIYTQLDGEVKTPVADAKLSAGTTDSNGDAVKQVVFRSSGNVIVGLTGATTPDVVVTVA